MPGLSLTGPFISRLNILEIPYVVTGALASIIYGVPRLTHDLDLVVMMKMEDTDRFIRAFPSREFYCPPAEILKIEIRRSHRGHFNLIHHETGAKADIYLVGEDDLNRWALASRRPLDFEGERMWVAPPEYVIIRKLEYFREGGSDKHLRDISGMLELSSDQIDFMELEEFIHRYGLESEWERAKAWT